MADSVNLDGLSQPPMMLINDQKAGMKGLDKERINRLICEASKGSRFYEHQLQKEEAIGKHCAKMIQKLESIDEAVKLNARREMDSMATVMQLERSNLRKIIVHMDMDMFYAAVEIKDNPSLAQVPMAVGTTSMLATSNYLARTYGVRAAMPGFIARKLCPQLKILPCNFKRYCEVSDQVMDVLSEYDTDYSSMGLDEAYLDITLFVQKRLAQRGESVDNPSDCNTLTKKAWGTAFEVVTEMRQKIFQKTGLTCSAGIAPNTMLAKISTDINKPNGQFMLEGVPQVVSDFINQTEVRKVPGIGPVQQKYLTALGISTCLDLWNQREIIPLLFTPSMVDFYMRVCLGIGSTAVKSDYDYVRKSKGLERTFSPTGDSTELLDILSGICKDVSESLVKRSLKGRTIVLRLKRDTFVVNTRNRSLQLSTNDENVLFQTAKQLLLAELRPGVAFRLLGVRVCNFSDAEDVCTNDKQKQLTIDYFFRNKFDVNSNGANAPSANGHEDVFFEEEFICAMCLRTFPDSVTLGNHVEICEEELPSGPPQPSGSSYVSNTYYCPVCNLAKFADLNSLNQHLDLCLNTSATFEEIPDSAQNRKRKECETQSKFESKKFFISDYFSRK